MDWRDEEFTSPRQPPFSAPSANFGYDCYQGPTFGRVHWASTETSTEFAGHVEGAIRAGARAARNETPSWLRHRDTEAKAVRFSRTLSERVHGDTQFRTNDAPHLAPAYAWVSDLVSAQLRRAN
ncbi:FAD-dependent oxidoreductase [Microbacterium sp. MMO-113]|uniref:FAD-dependent oxidoreductase n=1 Tax=Microbacterium sp. MMO-113 TaxID=3081273 RepID=UPI003FA52608